jgi:hypothetical protein
LDAPARRRQRIFPRRQHLVERLLAVGDVVQRVLHRFFLCSMFAHAHLGLRAGALPALLQPFVHRHAGRPERKPEPYALGPRQPEQLADLAPDQPFCFEPQRLKFLRLQPRRAFQRARRCSPHAKEHREPHPAGGIVGDERASAMPLAPAVGEPAPQPPVESGGALLALARYVMWTGRGCGLRSAAPFARKHAFKLLPKTFGGSVFPSSDTPSRRRFMLLAAAHLLRL